MDNIIVLKCGGSSVDELSGEFFANVQTLRKRGVKPVIVHGGGPAIKRMLDMLNIEFEFIDGLRKTTEPMMDIVEMVLTGHVNPALTRRVNKAGIEAVSVANVVEASPLNLEKYGYVGEVTDVDTTFMTQLLQADIVPVVSPVAIGEDDKPYNVNADTAAAAVASALRATQLIFVTDVPGILKNGELLERVTAEEIDTLISDGTIYGGMIPKVKAAMSGLEIVKEVMIVNGKRSELKDMTTLAGTTIVTNENMQINV